MGQELLFVYWRDDLYGFEFHDNLVLHDQVRIEAGINTNRIVDDWDGLLPKDTQFTLFQFVGQSCLVDRFQQTRPESSMHAKGCIDDLARDLIFIHCRLRISLAKTPRSPRNAKKTVMIPCSYGGRAERKAAW